MRRVNEFKEQKGYLTIAQNSEHDYLTMAYLQALSIKATQKINSYAVLVDDETAAQITDKHRKVFDHVIELPNDYAKDDSWKLANEWQVWSCTPFKETIKLDSDIILPNNIDHWWRIMQEKDVCCTAQIRNYEGEVSTASNYRKLFIDNNLPNVYSGFTYFRFTKFSMEFFNIVRYVFENWELFRDQILKGCRQDYPTTDEAYAIAALMMGAENCYLPFDIPSFVHMKGAIQGWSHLTKWTEHLYAQVDGNTLTVGFNRQTYPFHYVEKGFATEEIIEKYERYLGII